MKTKASQNTRRGSDFHDFLAGEGILPEVEVLAQRVGSLQLALTKTLNLTASQLTSNLTA